MTVYCQRVYQSTKERQHDHYCNLIALSHETHKIPRSRSIEYFAVSRAEHIHRTMARLNVPIQVRLILNLYLCSMRLWVLFLSFAKPEETILVIQP